MIDYTLPLDQLPDPLPIVPLTRPFDVTITPPGSKSITNRAYVLAALADGESRIVRPLRSDDCDGLLDALCTLGAEARWDGEDVLIKGVNGRFPRGGEVNLGDGGTPTRFMIACACLAAEPVVVDGSKRMRERPIAEGVDMLRQLGAHIEYIEEEGRLPVRVVPSERFDGGHLHVPTSASSQFTSATLLVGAYLRQPLELEYEWPITSRGYLSVTQVVMGGGWGVDMRPYYDPPTSHNLRGHRVFPNPVLPVRGLKFAVAPDASSAAYWRVAAAINPEARVVIPRLGIRGWQPDLSIALSTFYARARYGSVEDDSLEQVGPDRLVGCEIDARDTPDGSLALAIVAACAEGGSTLTGLHTLRVKETDRVAALANELRRIGCTVQTTEDSITIDPSTRHDDPVVIETYNDHRMAMAFAVLGLVRPNISIANPRCVTKSYPTFWQDFAKLYQ